MSQLLHKHYQQRKLEDLVENQTAYTLQHASLNIFETYQTAEKVYLKFDDPVIASMISGKKVMHLEDQASFTFLPGESVVVPSGRSMLIDFPEARRDAPTQCLALAIAPEKIEENISFFKEQTAIEKKALDWTLDAKSFHLQNDVGIQQLVERLIFLFTEHHQAKDVFADLLLKELIIRLLQTQARFLLIDNAESLLSDHRLAFVIRYIRDNLSQDFSVESLADKACMSKSHFFKCFKNTFGVSPIEYVNAERIKQAKKLLLDRRKTLSEVCFQVGFNNLSYFIRQFKRQEQMTPTQFRKAAKRSNI